MLFYISMAIQIILGAAALCTGTLAAAMMVSGRVSYKKWSVRFLRCSLGASAASILLSLHHSDPMRWLVVLGVYISGSAVLAWRRRGVSAGWVEPFVLSTLAALCLDVFIAVAHLFRFLDLANGTSLGSGPSCLVAAFITLVLFGALSGFGLNSIRHKAAWSIR